MSSYYFLTWKHKPEIAGAIYAVENQVSLELIPQLEGKTTLPLDFQLKRVKEVKDGLAIDNNLTGLNEIWLDYQSNSLAWPLMSERLKSVIATNLTGNEAIDWITCNVKNGNEERPYFILRFNKILDVLDIQKTLFVRGTDSIIKPVFAASKVGAYTIFTTPSSYDLWKISSGIYVSEFLKKEIQEQKLTGLDFEKTLVA